MYDLFYRPGAATNREYSAAVVDAVEPLIRADERARVCAHIRGNVERLTGKMIHRNHVLFLLDGIDDGEQQ